MSSTTAETRHADAAVRTAPTVRPHRVWLPAFITFLALISAWLLATPLFASPDEPEHVTRAAAVVRGELIGERPTGVGEAATVHSPRGVVSPTKHDLCFAFEETQPADCAQPLHRDAELVSVKSGAGLYIPVYYAVVGLPTLPFPDALGVYLMRLITALICAAFLASAFASAVAWRRSALLLGGLAVVVTPMVVFLAGTVNPNAVEICAAIALWVSGLVLVTTPLDERLSRTLVNRCGAAACAFVLSRQLSPFWLALVAAVLLVVAGRARVTALARRNDVRFWTAIATIATAVSIAWTVTAGALGNGSQVVRAVTPYEALRESVLRMPWRMLQLVGVFGWLDTRASWFTYVAWTALIGVVLLLGLAAATTRARLVVLAAVAITVAVPVLIEVAEAPRYGFPWQGRYTLPFAVGVPLLAAIAATSRNLIGEGLARPLVAWTVWVAGLAHVGAFWWALVRYQVGEKLGHNPLIGSWHPPVGSLAVLVLFAAATAALIGLVLRVGLGSMATSRSVSPTVGASADA